MAVEFLELVSVYIKKDRRIERKTIKEAPISSLIDLTRKGQVDKWIACIKDKVTKVVFGVDVQLMIMERNDFSVDTWEEWMDSLTEELVVGYKCDLFVLSGDKMVGKKSWKVFYPFNYKGLRIHYGSHDRREERDVYHYRFDLPDLVVTKEKIDTDNLKPDFTKCIGLTGGFFTRTLVDKDKDELYILDGTRYLMDTKMNERWQDSLVVDLSDLGKSIKQVGLSDLEIKSQTKYGNRLDLNIDWMIKLPDNKTFKDVTCLVVVSGVMVFPYQYQVSGNNLIRLKMNTLPIERSLMMKKRLFGELGSVGLNDESTFSYLNRIVKEPTTDNFVIMIEGANDLFVHESRVTPFAHHFMGINDRLSSLIRRETTGQMLSYAKIDQDSFDVACFADRGKYIDLNGERVLGKFDRGLSGSELYHPGTSYQTNPIYFMDGYQDIWKDDYTVPFKDLRISDLTHVEVIRGGK